MKAIENKIELPCDIGDKVYSISVNWSPCRICEHGKEMKNSVECLKINNYDCPEPLYTVEENICEAFIYDKDGVSMPGYIDPYDGFLDFRGCDDLVYYSHTKARLIAKKYNKEGYILT
jgi:hypothetical protein